MMVSKALLKFSPPVAKSCLIAIGVVIIIDAVLTIFAASSYPYMIAHMSELYVPSSRPITILYSSCSAAALLLALSSAWASYKSKTNYVLVHACITGVFLPVAILVYFTSISSRYKVNDFADNFRQMITDYRLTNQQARVPERILSSNSAQQEISQVQPSSLNDSDSRVKTSNKFTSFINIIDYIQQNFACCGVDSFDDWIKLMDGYVPPSCCRPNSQSITTNEKWAILFKVDSSQQISSCPETDSHQLGCLTALKDDEKSKFAWLADLIVFLMVVTIANTIISLLLFGLSKTEDVPFDNDGTELAMVGVSMKPRPSQPEITGIRHRPSVITMGANKEQIAAISQAVRFNLSQSPRASLSGPSKFSAAARKGSVQF